MECTRSLADYSGLSFVRCALAFGVVLEKARARERDEVYVKRIKMTKIVNWKYDVWSMCWSAASATAAVTVTATVADLLRAANANWWMWVHVCGTYVRACAYVLGERPLYINFISLFMYDVPLHACVGKPIIYNFFSFSFLFPFYFAWLSVTAFALNDGRMTNCVSRVRVEKLWSAAGGSMCTCICTYEASVREPSNMVHMYAYDIACMHECQCARRGERECVRKVWMVGRGAWERARESKFVSFVCLSMRTASIGWGRSLLSSPNFFFFAFPIFNSTHSTYISGPVLCLISTICLVVGRATMCEWVQIFLHLVRLSLLYFPLLGDVWWP